jgi:succinyl-diaminopimelate desuccinylase
MVSEKSITPRIPLSTEEERAVGYVDTHTDDLVRLLQDLVKIESIQLDPLIYRSVDEIFTFVDKYFRNLGIETQFFYCPFPYAGEGVPKDAKYPNLIIKLHGTAPGPTLQYCGHLDIVPYTPEKWNPDTPPLGGVIKDGRLYGRGACDMKGGVAGMIMAMTLIKKYNLPFKGTLQLWLTPDEETDAQYGARFMADKHIEVIKADATIIGEPTGQSPIKSPALILGEKGIQWWRLRFLGAAGHGSMPKTKSNAINKAVRFMANAKKMKLPKVKAPLSLKYMISSLFSRFTLKELLAAMNAPGEAAPDPRDEDGYALGAFFNTTCSFNLITAGTKVNVIPDICDLEVDLRILPGITTQQIIDSIVNYAATLGYRVQVPEEYTNCQTENKKLIKRPVDIEMHPIGTALGTFEPPESKFVDVMGNAFEAVYNVTKVFFFAPGMTDATHIRNKGVKGVVVFGPGGGNTHSANEYVLIDELVKCTKVYLLTALRFLQ